MVIKSFGKITDIIPPVITVTGNFPSWEPLKNHLFQQYPELQKEFVLVAVNNKIKREEDDFPLYPNDEIALMPPFSGG